MKKKIAVITGGMLPIAKKLPQGKAASIGRTLTRYAYLEWRLSKTIYDLLGISIKQGRVGVRLPQTRACVSLAEDLLTFLRVKTDFNFRQLGKTLDAAERARNTLAHSIYQEDGNKIRIQIVRGSWEFGQDVEPVKRALEPESKLVDRKFLADQRRQVEQAIKQAEIFTAFIHSILKTLNEKRRTQKDWDRRLPPRA